MPCPFSRLMLGRASPSDLGVGLVSPEPRSSVVDFVFVIDGHSQHVPDGSISNIVILGHWRSTPLRLTAAARWPSPAQHGSRITEQGARSTPGTPHIRCETEMPPELRWDSHPSHPTGVSQSREGGHVSSFGIFMDCKIINKTAMFPCPAAVRLALNFGCARPDSAAAPRQ